MKSNIKTSQEEPSYKIRLYRKQVRIRAWVLKIIESKGKKRKEIAESMKVDKSFLTRILKFGNNITLDTIAKLEEAFGETIIATPPEIENAIVNDFQRAEALYRRACLKQNKSESVPFSYSVTIGRGTRRQSSLTGVPRNSEGHRFDKFYTTVNIQ